MNEWDYAMMQLALEEAERAETDGEVPVGAVLVIGENIIAKNHNRSISLADPSAHAEIQVLREAGKKMNNYRLPNATLYVTIEPCLMCAGAILQARLARLVFGAPDPKAGAVVSLFQVLHDKRLNHTVATESGILQEACGKLLSRFFQKKRVIAPTDLIAET